MLKNEPGFIPVVSRYIVFCRVRIAIYILISNFFCIVVFFCGIYNDLGSIKSLLDIFYSSFINFVIFLPSIAFVMFGLLPSVGHNLKINLVSRGEQNSRKIEGVLDDLATVFYLSILSIGISIFFKMLWKSLSISNLDSLIWWQYNTFIISSFSIGGTLALMILDRIWMVISLVHSILLGDFEAIEKDFTETKDLMSKDSISNELYQQVIDTKIVTSLSASSISNIKTKILK